MLIGGIDPGAKGGIVLINEKLEIQEIVYEATALALRDLWKKYKPYEPYFYVEKVHAFPGAAAKSTFSFGKNYGEVVGALQALNIGHDFVFPKSWQYEYHRPYQALDDPKERTKRALKAIFPKLSLYRPGGTAWHDGVADALAIAIWGVQHGG